MDVRKIAREIVEGSVVLLKNEEELLPLRLALRLRSLAGHSWRPSCPETAPARRKQGIQPIFWKSASGGKSVRSPL